MEGRDARPRRGGRPTRRRRGAGRAGRGPVGTLPGSRPAPRPWADSGSGRGGVEDPVSALGALQSVRFRKELSGLRLSLCVKSRSLPYPPRTPPATLLDCRGTWGPGRASQGSGGNGLIDHLPRHGRFRPPTPPLLASTTRQTRDRPSTRTRGPDLKLAGVPGVPCE